MKQRCGNPNYPSYPHYGGRGIKYDKRWFYFDNFLEDMGERTDGTTLDRIDVNGDYNKDNCRWTSRAVQQRNLRCHLRPDVGVGYDKNHPTHKWTARINVYDKPTATRFRTKEEAIKWRKSKEKELWK